MTIPISEITVFYDDGEIQKLTGTYEVHDTYISIEIRENKTWHNIVIPMHAITGFEAHKKPKPLYIVNI